MLTQPCIKLETLKYNNAHLIMGGDYNDAPELSCLQGMSKLLLEN